MKCGYIGSSFLCEICHFQAWTCSLHLDSWHSEMELVTHFPRWCCRLHFLLLRTPHSFRFLVNVIMMMLIMALMVVMMTVMIFYPPEIFCCFLQENVNHTNKIFELKTLTDGMDWYDIDLTEYNLPSKCPYQLLQRGKAFPTEAQNRCSSPILSSFYC